MCQRRADPRARLWASGAGDQLPDLSQDLRATPHLDDGCELRELRNQHLAGVEPLRVMRSRVAAAGQAHDDDAVLESLDDDVAAARGRALSARWPVRFHYVPVARPGHRCYWSVRGAVWSPAGSPPAWNAHRALPLPPGQPLP